MSLIPELRAAFNLLEQPLFRHVQRTPLGWGLAHHAPLFYQRTPALDVREEKGEDGVERFVVEAELPGAKKEDVNVEFAESGRTLKVFGKVESSTRSGHPAATNPTAGASPVASTSESPAPTAGDSSEVVATSDVTTSNGTTWHAYERSYGSFARSIRFPVAVDTEAAKASYVDGILKVEVPKKLAESRKIEIA